MRVLRERGEKASIRGVHATRRCNVAPLYKMYRGRNVAGTTLRFPGGFRRFPYKNVWRCNVAFATLRHQRKRASLRCLLVPLCGTFPSVKCMAGAVRNSTRPSVCELAAINKRDKRKQHKQIRVCAAWPGAVRVVSVRQTSIEATSRDKAGHEGTCSTPLLLELFRWQRWRWTLSRRSWPRRGCS